MGKKDFSTSTENVFDDFFTQPTVIKEREVKEVKTKPAEEKKEFKVTPKKEETKKEKTPKQAEAVKEKVKTEEVKEVEKVEVETPKKNKSRLKECRFDFYAEVEYADFLNNYLWLRRCKNYSQYFNNLVKKDFLEFLNLPADTSNEVIAQKWEEYKKENDL